MGFLSKLTKAVSPVSGIISGGIDYFSAKDTQSKQKQAAREQMAFQERMSNTAYQRAVEDMRKAGINPMLAYAQGGASTPSGAQAMLRPPQVGDVALKGQDVGGKNTQRAVQNRQTAAQTQLTNVQTNTAREVQRREKAEADIRSNDARMMRKWPDAYAAYKLAGTKGVLADLAAEQGTSSAKSLLDVIRQQPVKQIRGSANRRRKFRSRRR